MRGWAQVFCQITRSEREEHLCACACRSAEPGCHGRAKGAGGGCEHRACFPLAGLCGVCESTSEGQDSPT